MQIVIVNYCIINSNEAKYELKSQESHQPLNVEV